MVIPGTSRARSASPTASSWKGLMMATMSFTSPPSGFRGRGRWRPGWRPRTHSGWEARVGLRLQHEVGVADLAELALVGAFDLDLGGHTDLHESLGDHEDHVRDPEGPEESDTDVDELGPELAEGVMRPGEGVPVNECRDDALHPLGHAVPPDALVRVGAVGEQADGQQAPGAGEAVHRDRAARVVDLGPLVEELDRVADDEPGHAPDDHPPGSR